MTQTTRTNGRQHRLNHREGFNIIHIWCIKIMLRSIRSLFRTFAPVKVAVLDSVVAALTAEASATCNQQRSPFHEWTEINFYRITNVSGSSNKTLMTCPLCHEVTANRHFGNWHESGVKTICERLFSPAIQTHERDPAQRSDARLGGGGSVSGDGVAFNAWSYSRKSSNVVSNSRRLASPAYSGELFTCAKCCNVSDRESC